jgi:CubicO group peptidase (beta-lactamase class C family)
VSAQDITLLQSGLVNAVNEIAGPLVSQGQTPGLMVGLLLPDGSTRFFGYGTTGQQNGAAPGPDTLFAIGSVSKGFLGAMTDMLVQEGRVSWTDTLPALLPPETQLSDDAARISVEQLATHTSGLPRQPTTLQTLSYFVQYSFTGDNFYRHLDREAVIDYLADFDAPSNHQPQYSNIGYGILGYAMERRTGQSLDDILAERITGPLGLAHTGYIPENLPGYDMRAIGHAGDQPKFIRRGDAVPDWHFTNILRGTAAMYSSARDLLTFSAAHLRQDGSPLTTALADTMRVRYPRPERAAAVAWVVDDVSGVHITYQVGLVAGYSTYLAINDANHTAVVVLGNAFNFDFSVGHRLMLMLAGPITPASGASQP